MNQPVTLARRIVPAAAAALALLPAAAQAGTASFSAGTLTITGVPGNDQIQVSQSYYGSTRGYRLRVFDSSNGVTLTQGGGSCSEEPPQYAGDKPSVSCTLGSVTATHVTLGGGNDSYSNYESGIADTVNGGDGNDEISGAVAGDDAGKEATDIINGDAGDDELSAGSGNGTTCNGGPGEDRMICFYVLAGWTAVHNGGPGRDSIVGGDSNDQINGDAGSDTRLGGGEGNDVIHGGDGDDGSVGVSDSIDGGPGADEIFGDAGVDRLVEDRNDDLKQFWSLDDQPNDGADNDENGVPDEGDNIHSDVENVTGGYDDDTIVGSGANNLLHGGSLGNDTIAGGGGDDRLYTGITGRTDSADGGEGNDEILGNGLLLGGPGNDQIHGQSDNDLIDAGPGTDTVSAGGGNDVVRTVDGATDQIGCGTGGDIAEVDSFDVVNTTDPGEICETVKVTAAASPIGQNPTGNPVASAVQLILGGTGTIKGSAAKFGLTAPGPGVIAATVLAPGKGARASARQAVLGKARKVVTKAGKVRLVVRLKGRAAKRLRRKRSFKVVLSTRFTPKGGKAGPMTKRTVTLRRK